MSLPLQAIDRLFDRFAATYGVAWMRQWEGVDAASVKTMWAAELAGYGNHLKAIAWALENLPERCPNLIEFRNLCRRAPAADVPMLPEPKADPQRVAAELAKLAPLRVATKDIKDHKAWAKKILADVDAGVRRNPTSVQMARDALRV
jgi:hypothetical protein